MLVGLETEQSCRSSVVEAEDFPEVLKCCGALNWTGIRHPPHKSKIAYKNNFCCLLDVRACYCGNALSPSAGSPPLPSLPVMHCQVLARFWPGSGPPERLIYDTADRPRSYRTEESKSKTDAGVISYPHLWSWTSLKCLSSPNVRAPVSNGPAPVATCSNFREAGDRGRKKRSRSLEEALHQGMEGKWRREEHQQAMQT